MSLETSSNQIARVFLQPEALHGPFNLRDRVRPPMVYEQGFLSGKLIARSLRCFLARLKMITCDRGNENNKWIGFCHRRVADLFHTFISSYLASALSFAQSFKPQLFSKVFLATTFEPRPTFK
jgi:hypothetical protein